MKPVNLNTIQNWSNATDIANPGRAESSPGRPPDGTPATALSGVSDQVTVSSRAEDFAQLVAKAGEGADIRHAKVAGLRQRIETGQYMVSSETIADAILRHENNA